MVFTFFFFQSEDLENSKSFHRVAEGEFKGKLHSKIIGSDMIDFFP